MSKIFFSGIGGSGMSAIAGFMADNGDIIVGSDRSFDRDPDNNICKVLKENGITIVPQDGYGIDSSFDFAVFSTAVENNQPEVIKARQLNIPIKMRPQYLSEITYTYKTIAVAGTSGKSTTAGLLAYLMDRLGMRPNFIGGGRVKQFKTTNNLGNYLSGDSDILIIEACESDGSIVHYRPFYSIVTNLSLDHNAIEKTAVMFEILAKNTKELLVIGGDDENLKRCNFYKPVRFSIEAESEYHAKAIEYQPLSTNFKLHGVRFKVSLPGKYNLYNALACISFLSEIGVPLIQIAEILPDFSGIDRRFDVYLNNGKHLVIDDYAHNPHKITCLMETLKRINKDICYIFQPHGYGPTRLMKDGYIEVFKKNLRDKDKLILLPIYYAGGTSTKDISSEDLCTEIEKAGKSVEVIHERESILGRLNEWDNYVVFGARDETLADFAGEIAMRLK